MEEKKAESLYNKKSVEMDDRAVELVMADETTRKAINTAIKDYNMALVWDPVIRILSIHVMLHPLEIWHKNPLALILQGYRHV